MKKKGGMEALIFDLDGTLVDSVYGHVLAFQLAFAEAGLRVESWRIHRHIGMSGDLLTQAVTRDSGLRASPRKLQAIETRHGELLHRLLPKPQPVPGAKELLTDLRQRQILHGIATSGKPAETKRAIEALGVGHETVVVNRSDTPQAKPEPDLFLECQKRLGVAPQQCYAVGDAVWDVLAARRAGMLGIGVLTGGYSESELVGAGAYRVVQNLAELHGCLGELGLSRWK
ncbi:MAG TPA: HAD family hydrolase [Verrucomicrobiae bacterium]|nr:HAD family hydrolase [Verrucomicrobiae bacterium]